MPSDAVVQNFFRKKSLARFQFSGRLSPERNDMNYHRKNTLLRRLKAKQDKELTREELRERNYYDSYGVNGADVGYRADTIRAVCAATNSIYLR